MPSYTKKHYEQIAAAVAQARLVSKPDLLDSDALVGALCCVFSIDNPNFDDARFVQACEEPWRSHHMGE